MEQIIANVALVAAVVAWLNVFAAWKWECRNINVYVAFLCVAAQLPLVVVLVWGLI